MKKIFLILSIILLAISAEAKIWRVNNSPVLDGDVLQVTTLFNNTNTAADPEAANGDSIYIEPSAIAYNNFIVNKQVFIFGYGYFLNSNLGMQASAERSFTNQVEFVAGSAGSVISGIEVLGVIYTTNVPNITITRCLMSNFILFGYTSNASGINLNKCYITSSLIEQSSAAAVTSIAVNIENCVFSATSNANMTGLTLPTKVKGLIRNCIFNGVNNFNCFNFYIANNIFIGNSNFGTTSNSGNNVYRNNILSYPANAQNNLVTNVAPNSSNLFGQNMEPIFVGVTDNTFIAGSSFNNRIHLTGLNFESRFDLEAITNVATAGGESGITFGGATVTTPACGVYGGTDPYRKGGFPNIPRITALTVPASVSNGAATMNISVSSSSNN